MIIIKKGVLPDEQQYQGSCTYCGTITRFTRKEATVDRDARNDEIVSVVCPLKDCQRLVFGRPLKPLKP